MKIVASFLILVASVAAGGCATNTPGTTPGAAVAGHTAAATEPSESELRARQAAWTTADAGRQCGYWPAGDAWSFYGYCYQGADPKYVGLDHDPSN